MYNILTIVEHCKVYIVLREGEVLEIPDFDDIYGSDQVSCTMYLKAGIICGD